MKYIVTLNSKNYEVVVEHGTAKIDSVTEARAPIAPSAPIAAAQPSPIPNDNSAPSSAPNSAQAVASAATPIPAQNPAPSRAANQTPGVHIKAPMQGAISEIKVELGQMVEKGDALAVLEAMKMENEITAPCSGKIICIAAATGERVNASDTIIVIG